MEGANDMTALYVTACPIAWRMIDAVVDDGYHAFGHIRPGLDATQDKLGRFTDVTWCDLLGNHEGIADVKLV